MNAHKTLRCRQCNELSSPLVRLVQNHQETRLEASCELCDHTVSTVWYSDSADSLAVREIIGKAFVDVAAMGAVRARIVEEFVEACDDTFPKYNLYHRRDAVNAANVFLDRNPHIIEGWPAE